MSTERGYFAPEGMGGFLCPPSHPEHTTSVQSIPRGNSWSMSLSAAVECEWLDPAQRAEAKRRLDEWQAMRPALDTPEVQEWVLQVLGYFRSCWRGEGPEPECWHCTNLRILKPGEHTPHVDEHAGMHLIRRYYPEFNPTREHFESAYWGEKPKEVKP